MVYHFYIQEIAILTSSNLRMVNTLYKIANPNNINFTVLIHIQYSLRSHN
jgi:hypothetical protein